MMLAAGTAAYAQTLSLRDCMEYALQHSPQKVKEQANLSDALLQRRDAILTATTPSITAFSGLSTNFGRAIDPETNSYISTTSLSNSYSINASMTLFDGFAAINNVKIAKTAVKMGRSRLQQLDDEICLKVMQAYYNLVYHIQLNKVLEAQVATAKENLKLVQRQFELGQKGYADVVQMEADLADWEYQLLADRNVKNEVLLDLKALLYWPLADTLMVDTHTAEEPQLSFTEGEETKAAALAYAQNALPRAELALAELKQAKWNLHTARGQFLPNLSVSGGWSTRYYTYPGNKDYKAPSFATQWRNNGGEYIQFSLSFPIYTQLSRFSNLSRKKNDYRRMQANLKQVQQEVATEVERAFQDCEGAQLAFLQAQKRLAVQAEAFKLNEKQLAHGLVSPITFRTIANAYHNAQAERLNALLRYYLKRSIVKYYQGISYLEQQK